MFLLYGPRESRDEAIGKCKQLDELIGLHHLMKQRASGNIGGKN